MKLLLVDFDGTLVTIKPFKTKFYDDLIENYHLKTNDINNALDSVKNTYGITNLKPFYLKLALLANKKPEEIKLSIYSNMKFLKINQKVLNFVNNFQGYKILFSYGEYDFQIAKIKTVKAQKVVDNVLITQNPKFRH